tara:strand:- start:1834 stop:2049 length:216 start_codon:yes stop_codon:yes gene_type:complete
MSNDNTKQIEIPHSDVVERIGIVSPLAHALESPEQKAKLLYEATKTFQTEWRKLNAASGDGDCPPPDCKSD